LGHQVNWRTGCIAIDGIRFDAVESIGYSTAGKFCAADEFFPQCFEGKTESSDKYNWFKKKNISD
jgi:1,4-alpha-glucan branching enzyme